MKTWTIGAKFFPESQQQLHLCPCSGLGAAFCCWINESFSILFQMSNTGLRWLGSRHGKISISQEVNTEGEFIKVFTSIYINNLSHKVLCLSVLVLLHLNQEYFYNVNFATIIILSL